MNAHLKEVLAVVEQILDEAGEEHVASIAFSRSRISIQPSRMDQGEAIARRLGLGDGIEQTSCVPPVTDWCGRRDELLEIHLRGTRTRAVVTA